jgi:MmoB/DmpM family
MEAPEIRSRDTVSENAVGPILRAGEIAEAAIGAIAEDNPDKEVSVVDRGDYVRIHTDGHCRLTQATLEKHLGRAYDLPMLEIEMPSFSGRLRTRWNEYVWYYENA